MSHWYDDREKSRRKRYSNPGSSAPEVDALTTRPVKGCLPRWPGGKASCVESGRAGIIPHFRHGAVSRSRHGRHSNTGTLRAALTCAWRFLVSDKDWLVRCQYTVSGGDRFCNFCLSMVARTIVTADPSLRYTSIFLGL